VTIFALWSPATSFDFLRREISIYLPLAIGFGMLMLIFGAVPFLIALLRGSSNNSLKPGFITGAVPPGPPAPPPLEPKTLTIGPYRVASTLGTGGMGTVFKGVDPQGRTVAIKMIGGSQLNGTALRQAKRTADVRIGLVREARLAAELRHPNIVEIYDIGQNKGALYVVMELLEGRPLDRYARAHPISAPEALRIVSQLCDALDCAHSHGIIHRDIKPANMFVTETGTVKVLDFGIALPPEQDEILGTAIGTPHYMSPEQIMGREVDGRTDVWSAGVTLFQLLTTRMPFQGRTMAELFGNILSSPTPQLPFAGPFAEEFNRLMEKALARDRDQRYATASEFGNDLRLVLQHLSGSVAAQCQPSAFAAEQETQQVQIRPTYQPIRLGFREQRKGRVFLFPVPTQRGLPLPEIPWFVSSMLGTMASVAVGFGLGLTVLKIAALVGVLLISIIIAASIYKLLKPAPFYCCRSCEHRMRSVTAWSRPTWLSEQNSFCIPDCIAALGAGLWEEAVKVLWIHTSEEKSDRQYRLEFFECTRCGDQRAYLTLRLRFDGESQTRGLREAYRFGTPENAQRFFAKSQSSGQPQPIPPESVPATAAFQNGTDVHNQTTM
jgi:Protein kinase domain